MTCIIGHGRSTVHGGGHIEYARRMRGGTYIGDHKGGITEIVELIDGGEDDGPEHSEQPRSEGVDGHGLVIVVCDGGTDLWIGRVVL